MKGVHFEITSHLEAPSKSLRSTHKGTPSPPTMCGQRGLLDLCGEGEAGITYDNIGQYYLYGEGEAGLGTVLNITISDNIIHVGRSRLSLALYLILIPGVSCRRTRQ